MIVDLLRPKVFNDGEIAKLIEDGHIKLKNPELYLGERRHQLIQPGTMDLILAGHYDSQTIELFDFGKYAPFNRLNENPNEEFVTFWPYTSVNVGEAQLLGYTEDALKASVEIRSTMRRLGLDIRHMPHGPKFRWGHTYAMLEMANFRIYPI